MSYEVHCGDATDILTRVIPASSVQTCVTSPPYYGLRDYGVDGQIGLEPSPEEYIAKLVEVFRGVRRVLKDDGTLWLNIGDSYARTAGDDSTKITDSGMKTGRTGKSDQIFKKGNNKPPLGCKNKDLIGIPWMLAFALRTDGWYLRQDVIWHKPNPMPESVKDRCTKAHEYIFLLSKSEKYFFDSEAMKENSVGSNKGKSASFKRENSKRGIADVCPASPMATHRADREDVRYDGPLRNRRSVWTVATKPYKGAHFATFPPALIEPCILAGSRPGDIVLDPFSGSGTTAEVAVKHGRKAILCELNPGYLPLIEDRMGRLFI